MSERQLDVPVDREGFLRHLDDWNPDVAVRLAAAEGIELTPDHWRVIELARDYYDRYHISPAARVLVKRISDELGPDKGSSIFLMQLFSGRPARFVSKIAGLPKPPNCD